MNPPSEFITNVQHAFGDEGKTFLANLQNLIEIASSQWGLSEIRPVENLSYNFVAFAHRPSTSPKSGPAHRSCRPGLTARTGEHRRAAGAGRQGEDVVLKIGVPNRELASEMAALRLFDGNGAVRLLEADEQHFMFLLERLKPGKMVSTLEDDDQATNIAANVMLALWRKPAENTPLIQLKDWFAGLEELRPAFNGGTGPFPQKIVAEVEELLPRLFAEPDMPLVIHGDLHHFNILSSDRGWLAIDPKGVIGPAGYETGPFLINPWGDVQKISQLAERRIAIFSERLGFSRQLVRDWGLCHALLSAWWGFEDGSDWKFAMSCAEVFSAIQVGA